MELILILYYGAKLVGQELIFFVGCVCHAIVLSSPYTFLHFHIRITVIHQVHKVKVSSALLQHVYPSLIASVPNMLCALARVAIDNTIR